MRLLFLCLLTLADCYGQGEHRAPGASSIAYRHRSARPKLQRTAPAPSRFGSGSHPIPARHGSARPSSRIVSVRVSIPARLGSVGLGPISARPGAVLGGGTALQCTAPHWDALGGVPKPRPAEPSRGAGGELRVPLVTEPRCVIPPLSEAEPLRLGLGGGRAPSVRVTLVPLGGGRAPRFGSRSGDGGEDGARGGLVRGAVGGGSQPYAPQGAEGTRHWVMCAGMWPGRGDIGGSRVGTTACPSMCARGEFGGSSDPRHPPRQPLRSAGLGECSTPPFPC